MPSFVFCRGAALRLKFFLGKGRGCFFNLGEPKIFLLFKKYSIIVLKEVILVNFKEVLNEYLKELNKIKNEIKKDNITKRNRRKY